MQEHRYVGSERQQCSIALPHSTASSCIPDIRPLSLRFIAPVLRLPGMNPVVNITDLWWSPLLSDKRAPLVRGYAFSAHPFEVILTGTNGPDMIA